MHFSTWSIIKWYLTSLSLDALVLVYILPYSVHRCYRWIQYMPSVQQEYRIQQTATLTRHTVGNKQAWKYSASEVDWAKNSFILWPPWHRSYSILNRSSTCQLSNISITNKTRFCICKCIFFSFLHCIPYLGVSIKYLTSFFAALQWTVVDFFFTLRLTKTAYQMSSKQVVNMYSSDQVNSPMGYCQAEDHRLGMSHQWK